jgi:hypothetical protein
MVSTFNIVQDDIITYFAGTEWSEIALDAFKDKIPDVESYGRLNAPWTDNTGAARAGLTADVAYEEGEVFMTFFHTVDYDNWLELIKNGNYAIILPTLEAIGPSVLAHVAESVKARSGTP